MHQEVAVPVFVPAFPTIVATIRDDNSGELIVNGTALPLQAGSVALLRAGVIARCSATARRIRRPVRIQVTDVAGSYKLAIHPDAYVQVLDVDGTVLDPPAARQRVIGQSPCRRCQISVPLNETDCPNCGIHAPHNVQVAPASIRAGSDTQVIDAAHADELLRRWARTEDSPDNSDNPDSAVDELLEESTRRVARSPRTASPRLQFESGQTVTVESTALLGRKPTPDVNELVSALIVVDDDSRTVSKTHVRLEWLDQATLWVTDRHSPNGVDVQRGAQPPILIEPGIPFELHDGDQIALGELHCTVRIDAGAGGGSKSHE